MSRIKLPTRDEILNLAQIRSDACVSIYAATSPVALQKDHCRIEIGNMVREALKRLETEAPDGPPLDKRRLAKLRDGLETLTGADDFCLDQSNSLALLATPDASFTFQMPNRLNNFLEVADRFYLKPLLRAITFDHRAYVLALSENQTRVIELLPDCPAEEIKVPGLPADLMQAAGVNSPNAGTRPPNRDESEIRKKRQAKYIRQIDDALRAFMGQGSIPLILAATEPLSSMFRAQATVNMTDDIVSVSPDHLSVGELSELARPVLDKYYQQELEAVKELFEQRTGQNRVVTDPADVARAATNGMISLALVDFDYSSQGVIDENGNITYGEGTDSYGVIDEIVKRAMQTGSRVMAVRGEDMVSDTGVAAILRYTM